MFGGIRQNTEQLNAPLSYELVMHTFTHLVSDGENLQTLLIT